MTIFIESNKINLNTIFQKKYKNVLQRERREQDHLHPPHPVGARDSGKFPSPKQAGREGWEEAGDAAVDGGGAGDREQEADQEGLVQDEGSAPAGGDRGRTVQGKDQ